MIERTAEDILAELLRLEVLVQVDDDQKLRLGDKYFQTHKQFQQRDESDIIEVEKQIAQSDTLPKTFAETQDENFKYDILTLQEFLPERDFEEICVIASSLDWVREKSRTKGVPAGFTPIRARDIELFLEQFPTSIVYIWQEESEQCNLVKNQLEYLQDEGDVPDELGLGAIYGPENIQYLIDEFNVGLLPTLFFCADGRVDSRLIGYHSPKVVQNEISIIRDEIK